MLIVALIGWNFLFPYVWYSPELRAQLVTTEGIPVEGAVVITNWEIENWISGTGTGQLAIRESITDKSGWFSVPSWGPRFALHGALDITAPTIYIFHHNFWPLAINNFDGVPTKRAPSIIRFRLQNQKIQLEPFRGPLSTYQDQERLEAFIRRIRDIYATGWDEFNVAFKECYWKDTPQFLAELQRMNDRLNRDGAGFQLRTGYEHVYNARNYCNENGQK